MRNTINENKEIDITNNFGSLYHPKSALLIYQTEGHHSDMYVEHFDIDSNGNPINAHPLTVREAQRLAKTLTIHNKKTKIFKTQWYYFSKCAFY